ncbi:hypothetical protein Cni_G04727 [Canna indica]|uniref:RNase H type-1 domain-containing protein n=1 Tax=Canna indica TaxID=4628 RepID=A0AAQ3JXN6_9LILI|nr:hypothetical protein Cni_G04727 [Canna indica]
MSTTYGWKAGSKMLRLNFKLTGQFFRFFSARRASPSPSVSLKSKELVEEKGEAFYVVRKGCTVGLYKSLSDCQIQVSAISDPPVSVFKGYSLKKETEEYFDSRGLKNALYTLNAKDLKEDLFGLLVPCPFQEPVIASHTSDSPEKTSLIADEPLKEYPKLEHSSEEELLSDNPLSCTLEFDGASKKNGAKGGAGAILRTEDGHVICQLREGLGAATNNCAEYRALILGLQHALKKGFKKISVQGDSRLVCMQVQGLWKNKNNNLADLCKEAKRLKDMFESFNISHVKRGMNSAADAEANLAIDLPAGEIYEC